MFRVDEPRPGVTNVMFVSSFPAAICMCTTLEAAGLTIGLELWMMALCDGGGMNRLLFQAVFLAMGLTAGVRLFHDVTPSLVYGALVAVCCAALGEYAGCMPLTVMLLVVLDCGACLVWSWCLLLPIAAFNAALLQDGKPVMVVARWLWLMPILTMALRCGHADVRPLPATQVALLTTLGFACGTRHLPNKSNDCRIPSAAKSVDCDLSLPNMRRTVRWRSVRQRSPNERESPGRSTTMSGTC